MLCQEKQHPKKLLPTCNRFELEFHPKFPPRNASKDLKNDFFIPTIFQGLQYAARMVLFFSILRIELSTRCPTGVEPDVQVFSGQLRATVPGVPVRGKGPAGGAYPTVQARELHTRRCGVGVRGGGQTGQADTGASGLELEQQCSTETVVYAVQLRVCAP